MIKPKLDQEYIVPDEKIILRYTTAIYDKHKKYLEYRAKSTVAKNDAYVIAVNGFPLAYRGTDSKRILKAVFPIGPLEYSFNNAEIRYQFRPIIYKNTGGKVSTEFFINNQYCGISAVLHSYANAGMTMVPLGIDFLVVHNPMALRPVPHRLITATREYWATPVDSEYMELSVTTAPNKTNRHTAARTLSDILEEISNNRRYRGK